MSTLKVQPTIPRLPPDIETAIAKYKGAVLQMKKDYEGREITDELMDSVAMAVTFECCQLLVALDEDPTRLAIDRYQDTKGGALSVVPRYNAEEPTNRGILAALGWSLGHAMTREEAEALVEFACELGGDKWTFEAGESGGAWQVVATSVESGEDVSVTNAATIKWLVRGDK